MPLSFRLYPFERVGEAIESWRPRNCSTERDYENSLARKFQRDLVNQRIDQQYGSGRQRVDIVVDGRVPVELKKDISSNADLHRTIGQLDQYEKTWKGAILVLCGEAPRHVLHELRDYAKKHTNIHVYAK